MSEKSNAISVGRVVGLWRYPVKSMGAEALTEAEVDWNGISGDRRWAFVRDNKVRSGFPWLTLANARTWRNTFYPSAIQAAQTHHQRS